MAAGLDLSELEGSTASSRLIQYLRECRLISEGPTIVKPLSGGVSSSIVMVENDGRRVVVKQALARLKVKDAWYCSTDRSITEFNAIHHASTIIPGCVPQLIFTDRENRLFLMEFLGNEYLSWKAELLQGHIDSGVALRAAGLLARLHQQTWQDDKTRQLFNTTEDFHALRIEPYLLTTGSRHPALLAIMRSEAERLRKTRLALVHGDFSAKNIMVSAGRLVLIDWEVAWFGDPAFDSAFLLNLLYLKSLYRSSRLEDYLTLIRAYRDHYRRQLPEWSPGFERRVCRLTQMLMLARIDGKSPAEYLTQESDKQIVRNLIRKTLLDDVDRFNQFDALWENAVTMR